MHQEEGHQTDDQRNREELVAVIDFFREKGRKRYRSNDQNRCKTCAQLECFGDKRPTSVILRAAIGNRPSHFLLHRQEETRADHKDHSPKSRERCFRSTIK